MINILAVCPVPNDGTSFYRGLGPLIELRRERFCDFKECAEPADIDWDSLMHFDVLFLQRPFRQDHLQIAINAVRLGLKVWVDFDDWLIDIPSENKCKDPYEQSNAGDNIKKILSHPNILVTCSTQYLADLYQQYSASEVRVVNNAINTRVFGKGISSSGENTIGWRGSETHVKDLMEYKDSIIDVMRSNRDTKFEYIGYNPWFLTEESNTKHVQGMPIIDYMYYIGSRKRKAFFVTLHDCDFNRAKSNILWIEATWAGAVVVAPNWDEWRRPGVLTYNTQDEFMDIMDKVCSSDYMLSNWEKSRDDMVENYSLSIMNGIRKVLLERLTNNLK